MKSSKSPKQEPMGKKISKEATPKLPQKGFIGMANTIPLLPEKKSFSPLSEHPNGKEENPALKNGVARITAIIPTFNEEENLVRAIESVQFADEIIVVDSFSTDRTLEIAQQFGAQILQRKYETAAIQKNWTIPKATHEWIILLDADEWLPKSLQEEIQKTIKAQPKEVAFWIGRNNTFMGQPIRYSGWQHDRVIRLFHRDFCRYDDKRVHEEVVTDGEIGLLQNRMEHNTYRAFDHYVEKLNRYAWLQALDYDKKINRITLFHILVKPPVRFFKHYFIGLGFLDGFPGFMISILQAYAVLTRYAKLWLIKKGIYK